MPAGTFALSTASVTDTASMTAVPHPPAGPPGTGPQLLRIGVTATGAPGAGVTATVNFALCNTVGGARTIVQLVQATITGTALRATSGGSGDYACTVDFGGGTDMLDITGANDGYKWYAGMSGALAGSTTQYNFTTNAANQV